MLKNKIVVITGGAGLIGAALVEAVIREGGTAVIADLNEDAARKVKAKLMKDFDTGVVDVVKLNITSEASITDAIEHLNKKYAKIDALVNNAYPKNKNYGKVFFDVGYDDFIENVGLNLGGCFLTAQQFAKFFKIQGYGNIINIASIYGVVSPMFELYDDTEMTMPVEYSAIKSGLIHLTRYMAKYFKGMNIKVNAISPGGISNQQPVEFLKKYKAQCINKGMLDPNDLQGTLLYLLSDMSKYVNGQNLIVDDGFCL